MLKALLEGLEVSRETLELFLEVLDLATQFADFCRGLAGSLILADLIDGGLGGLAFRGVGVGGDEGGEDRDGPGVTQFPEGPHRGGGHGVFEVVDMAEEEVANGVLVVLVPREVSESAQGLGEAAAGEGDFLLLEVPKEGVDV